MCGVEGKPSRKRWFFSAEYGSSCNSEGGIMQEKVSRQYLPFLVEG